MKKHGIIIFMVLILPLAGLLKSCLPDGEYKIAVNYQPAQNGDGWEISDAASEGFNTGRLQEVYDMMFEQDKFLASRSLLIVKNGKLVSESYFRDKKDIDRKGNIKGITKSFTSVLAGFAWDRELIDTGNRLYALIPGYFDGDRDKRDITMEHIFTMQTGLEWDDEIHTRDLFNVNRFPSSIRVVLTKPLINPAGTVFSCNEGTPQLAMGVLCSVFGMEQTDSLINKLFKPLGIDDFVWEQHDDGLHYGGTGLHLKARDLARFGQFCLQKGKWDGRQLVSQDWMNLSTGPVLDPEMTGSPIQYGYFWWVDPVNNAFLGKGAGGQYLYIVPSLDLVIVHTATSTGGPAYEGIVPEDFLSLAGRIISSLE